MAALSRKKDRYPHWLRIIFRSRFLRLLFFIYITFLSTILFAGLAYGIIYLSYGYGFSEVQTLLQQQSALAMPVIKFYQLILSIGMFLIPPVVFAYLTADNPWAYLKLNKGASIRLWLIVPLILFFAFVMENWVLAVNQAIELPPFMESVKTQEKQIDELLKGFLKMDSVGDLIINLIIVGVVAAVAEELFFRGFLQRYLSKWFGNIHWGLWVAALVFGAIHQQFYNVLPRILLGGLLGYLFYWSGSLWMAMGAHFLHNAVQVVAVYLYPAMIDKQLSVEQAFQLNTVAVVIICSVLFAWVMQIFYLQATADKVA